MPAPTLSWDLVDLHATWLENGAMKQGTYEISIPVRLTSAVDDSIIPAAVYQPATPLNMTPGVPSLRIQVPATDDPDITSVAPWRLHVVVKFLNGIPETYDIDVPYAARPTASGGTGAGVNLRTFAPNEGTVALAAPSISFTGPYSVATRDAQGRVLDGNGNPVSGGGSVPLLPDPALDGFFTIPTGSSVSADPSRPGFFLIGV